MSLKIAFYGKGGIGKSTTVSNISVSLAKEGYRVMQIGCDPKADSTIMLHDGKRIKTVLELMREGDFEAKDMVTVGDCGVLCVEAGGPTPGLGCAGRGIAAALEKLEQKGAFKQFAPDIIFYDCLGDVVCGGFSMPMRSGFADSVIIITSGEEMALHAAGNIALAIENFRDRGYASLGGIILNKRNVKNEEIKTEDFAAKNNTEILSVIDRSDTVTEAEELGKTVACAFSGSFSAAQYRSAAKKILLKWGEKLC